MALDLDDVDAIAFARIFPAPNAACVIRRLVALPSLGYDDSEEASLVFRPPFA